MHTGLDGVTSGFEGVFHDASTNRLFVARALSGAAKVLGLSGSSEPAADDEGILGQLHSLLAAPRVRLAHSARSLASFASYTDLRLSHTEIVRWGPESHSDLGKAETS